MRLGGPVFGDSSTPEAWVRALENEGYRAAFCPKPVIEHPGDEALGRAFAAAAEKAKLVIAEVGAWSNPIAADEAERRKALELCKERLALAEVIGARCCVNICGSRGERWAGPHPDNLTNETFEMIVASVREIVDAVKPTRSCYALETMPWVFPDSPENYLELLKAIDRPGVAVHLDPVNMINSAQRCFENAAFLRRCFKLLGPYIRSCHGKDTFLHDKLTVHLDEVAPGKGTLDYKVFLTELAKLDPDTTLMLEHLKTQNEYREAASYVRTQAEAAGVAFV